MSFAKLFDSEEFGQIVVFKDTDDQDNPCIVFMFDPQVDGVENCKSRFGFKEESNRDSVFEYVSLAHAEHGVRGVFEMVRGEE